MIASPLLSNVRHRAMIMPLVLCILGSFILTRVTGQCIVRLKLFSKWEKSVGLGFKSNVLWKSIALKKIRSDIAEGSSESNGLERVKRERTKGRKRLLRTRLFYSGHLQHERERPDMECKYMSSDKVQ